MLALDGLLDSIMRKIPKERVVIITSLRADDDYVEEFCTYRSLNCYRGSLENVFDRFAAAATVYSSDWYIRINGDSIALLDEVFEQFEQMVLNNSEADLFSTVGSGLPSGLHFEAVSKELLKQTTLDADSVGISDYEKEHVFPAFYNRASNPARFTIAPWVFAGELDFSLDTARDLQNRRVLSEHSFTIRSLSDIPVAAKKISEVPFSPFSGTYGPLVIAEIGGNHEGSYEKALSLVELAITTEVDAVKLQLYSPDLLVNATLDPDRHAHFANFTLTPEQNVELLRRIRSSGKLTCASVWSLEELSIYEEYVDIIKVGSGDFDDYSMLAAIAKSDKPIILSTGLSDYKEVTAVISYLVEDEQVPAGRLSLLQCTSMYPIPPVEANLAVMDLFRHSFGISVGYSDHTVGIEALALAAACGAEVLEFHFSDDTKNCSFRDHLVSLDADDTSTLLSRIANTQTLLGSKQKSLTLLEEVRLHPTSFRKGLYLKNRVSAGDIISKDELITLRPRKGLAPVDAKLLIGAKALQNIDALAVLDWSMFEVDGFSSVIE